MREVLLQIMSHVALLLSAVITKCTSSEATSSFIHYLSNLSIFVRLVSPLTAVCLKLLICLHLELDVYVNPFVCKLQKDQINFKENITK